MLQKMRAVIAIFIALSLSGCVSVNSQVTRFHKLEKGADGKYGTYAFYIPPEKQSSLEFATNLDRVKAYLNSKGFSEASSPGTADVLAFLNYSVIAAGSSSTYTPPVTMGGTSAFAQGFNSASGGGSISTTDMYTRTLNLRLAKFSAAGTPPQTVYEGTVASSGSSGSINSVMPTLLKALFTEFPGRSGESVKIVLPLEK